jgi:hypothetical protein
LVDDRLAAVLVQLTESLEQVQASASNHGAFVSELVDGSGPMVEDPSLLGVEAGVSELLIAQTELSFGLRKLALDL